MTLPRGPIESQQSWYAGARLGVYICTCIIWGHGLPEPEVIYWVSRCKEKSPPYSMWIYKQLINEVLNFSGVDHLQIWSDGGRHFRSSVGISTQLSQGIASLCLRSDRVHTTHEVSCNFGLAAHFKNACDGAQAHARNLLDEMAKGQIIKSIDSYVHEARKLYDVYAADPTRPPRMKATWKVVFPTESRKDFCKEWLKCFAASSFRESIMVSQCYSAKLNDVRRRGNPLFVDRYSNYTALNFRCPLLPDGSKVPHDLVCVPKDRPIPVDDPEAEEGEPAVDAPEEAGAPDIVGDDGVPVRAREVNGWMCSYRSNEPEAKEFKAWRARFTKVRSKFARWSKKLALTRTRRPQAEQLALQATWASRKRRRKAT